MSEVAYFPVENGVLTIGDLWDMRTSKRVGFNLYGANITSGDPPTFLERGDPPPFESSFEYVKDSSKDVEEFGLGATITCDLLGGMIKISGGFDFEMGFSRESNTERMKKCNRVPLNAILIKPNVDTSGSFDPHVEELLKTDNPILSTATHVVTGMSIGGVYTSTLNITQTKSGDKYKLDFFIDGDVNLIALSGKLGIKVGVGEEIEETNYSCTINLASVPPISAPTGVEDFMSKKDEEGNEIRDKVSTDFIANLEKENSHFSHWEVGLNNGEKLVGIPISFTLTPLSLLLPEEVLPDNSGLEVPSPAAELKKFSEAFLLLRDYWDSFFLQRQVLAKQKRAYKLLKSSTDPLADAINREQRVLSLFCENTRKKGLENYREFTSVFYDPQSLESDKLQALAKFGDDVDELVEDMMGRKTYYHDGENKEGGWIGERAQEARSTILSIVVIEEDNNENDEEEELSPLTYLSNPAELNFWLNSQRFCKLLYGAVEFASSEENEDTHELQAIRQTLFKMSRLLGSINIQAGIAYPNLLSTRRKEAGQLLLLKSPNGEIIFLRENKEGIMAFLHLLSALTFQSVEDPDGGTLVRPEITHLYQTFCETQGLHFKLSDSFDLIPLLNLVRSVFGPEKIQVCPSKEKMLQAIRNHEDKEEIILIVTQDGVQASRSTLYTMLLVQTTMQELGLKVNLISGSHEIEEFSDAPPLFIAWDGGVRAVCLDHLDTLVLLHILETTEEREKRNELIEEKLGFDSGRLDKNLLCSRDRKGFAQRVRSEQGKVVGKEEPKTLAFEPFEVHQLLEEMTAYLNSHKNSGPVPFINSFARFAHKIVEDVYEEEDFSKDWYLDESDGRYKFSITEPHSEDWSSVASAVDTMWAKDTSGKEDYYKFYGQMKALLSLFYTAVADVLPDPKEEGEAIRTRQDDAPDLETSQGQYDLMSRIVAAYPDQSADSGLGVWVEEVHGIRNLSPKASGFLYLWAINEVISTLEEREVKFRAVSLLAQSLYELADKAKLSPLMYGEVFRFTLNEIERENPGFLEEEIVRKIKEDLRYSRYYHVVSHLVENIPDKYEPSELSRFHLEMVRMTELEDWWNLIRVIEELAKFEERIQAHIWRNPNFEYMMMQNFENQHVLEVLIKLFMREGPSVPKFIPREIAVAMLRYNLTPEGYPYLFDPVWMDKEVLLKSLQVLYISKQIPADFQTLLLRNILREDKVVYEAFREAGILEKLYWSEEKKYFTEVWDLSSILIAIEALMGIAGSKSASKMGNSAVKDLQASIVKVNLHQTKSINTSKFLEFKLSSDLDKDDPLDAFLYYTKHSKFQPILEEAANPFISPKRVDLLTHIFSAAERPVGILVMKQLELRYGIKYALPAIVQNEEEEGHYISLLRMGALTNFARKEGGDYPKVVTAIRIGPDHIPGKSSFINCLVAKEEPFSSFKENVEKPLRLLGYAESFPMKGESASLEFWNKLEKREDFVLLNLHGNALDIHPDVVKELQAYTSDFVVFVNPFATMEETEGAIAQIKEALKPGHAQIFLYIDPKEEMNLLLPTERILSSEEIAGSKNLGNMALAFSTALNRRGRMSQVGELTVVKSQKYNENALEFANLLETYTIGGAKSSLFLTQARDEDQGPVTPAELKAYYEKNTIYSSILKSFSEILEKEPNPLEFLQDLAALLTFNPQAHFQLSAWTNLRFNPELQGFDSALHRDLMPFLQNNVDLNLLTIGDIIYEICRFKELLPVEVPEVGDILPVLIALFEEQSMILTLPSTPSGTFFDEFWSIRFAQSLEERRIQVVSCVGGEEGSHITPFLLESLFGPDFLSAYSLSSWSETAWSSGTIRLLHFPEEGYSGVQGILLIESRPLNQERLREYPERAERDRQIMTFLLAISNITLVLDLRPEITGFLEAAFGALNKLQEPGNGRLPELIFVGVQGFPEKEEVGIWVSSTLNRIKEASDLDYANVSSFGVKTLQRAVKNFSGNFFNLIKVDPEGKPQPSLLADLSDRIISTISRNHLESENLPDFLPTLGPIWKEIALLPMPYPDLDEVERAKKFREILHNLLNLIDICFRYHVEEFRNLIFEGVSNFVNAFVANDPGEITIPKKREILWKQVSIFLEQMFGNCEKEEGEACGPCTEKEKMQEEILAEWEDLIHSPLTKELLLEKVMEYIEAERKHHVAIAKQTMHAFEERAWQEEEVRFEEGESEFEKEQEFALKVAIVRSKRRILLDFEETFPEEEVPVLEVEPSFGFLKELPAWEHDQSTLSAEQADSLQRKVEKAPEEIIAETGFNAIYQKGMVRLIEALIEKTVEEWLEEEGQDDEKKLLGSFKLAIIKNGVVRLAKKLELQEAAWEKEHNPLVVYLERPT